MKIRQHLAQADIFDEQGAVLEKGDHGVIASEPFQDADAIFDKRLSAAGRGRVLIWLLPRWAALDTEARALRKDSPFARAARAVVAR